MFFNYCFNYSINTFQIISHILSYDIWYYLSHILLHNKNIYYIHKIHHITLYENLTYFDANKGHILEHIIPSLGIFIPFFIYEFYFINFLISYIIISIRTLIRHDHRFSWIIGNHHLLHHKYPKYNFGEFWIDYMFNTIYYNNDEYIYGIIYT
jgi:lathosterol oxidase